MKTILDTMWSFVPARCLQVAARIGLFDHLRVDKELDTKVLASELGTNADALHRLLCVLACSGIVELTDIGWKFSASGFKYLSAGSSNSLLAFVERSAALVAAYDNLEEVLKSGSPDREMLELTQQCFGGKEAETQVFAKSMEAMSSVLAAEMVESVDLTEYSDCLDIGSGWGVFGRTMIRRWPGLSVTLFDLPHVIQGAKERCEKLPFGEQIHYMRGDWRDQLPDAEFDVVLLSQVLHEEPKEAACRLLTQGCERVRRGGIVIVVEFFLSSSKTDPLLSTIFHLNMLVEIGGATWSTEETESFLHDKGFEVIEVFPLSGGRTVVVGRRL